MNQPSKIKMFAKKKIQLKMFKVQVTQTLIVKFSLGIVVKIHILHIIKLFMYYSGCIDGEFQRKRDIKKSSTTNINSNVIKNKNNDNGLVEMNKHNGHKFAR